jgi:hypothetical protein
MLLQDCVRAITICRSDVMSELGHEQTSRNVRAMSAFPPIADIRQCGWDVRKVPITDIPDPKEKRVSLTQKATRANVAKKEKPDLRGDHSPRDSEIVGLPVNRIALKPIWPSWDAFALREFARSFGLPAFAKPVHSRICWARPLCHIR